MDICVDVGNTLIKIGIFEGDDLLTRLSFKNVRNTSEEEFLAILRSQINDKKIDPSQAERIIFSSVVPQVNNELISAIETIFNQKVMVLGPGVKTGIILKVDNPNEVGSDLIADLVGGKERYKAPLLIVDLGTASKILFLDENNSFSSALIMPGMALSGASLSNKAALLPEVGIKKPKPILDCHNTVDTMTAGLVYGHASMIEGLIERYEKELSYRPKVILTGGASRFIKDYVKHDAYDLNLNLYGLKAILNKQKKK